MEAILNDPTKFIESKNDILENLPKFQGFIRRNKNVFGDQYDEIYPTAANVPKLYGLPKIHKANCPVRPILSMYGTMTQPLAKWTKTLLSPLVSSPSMIKDSFSLAAILGKSHLHDAYLVSYDVTSLFTNIPVDETIDIILTMIRKSSPQNTKIKNLQYDGVKWSFIKKSLKWCLKNNTFLFNRIYYKQIDGCALGSPLASLMADIFMNEVIETY